MGGRQTIETSSDGSNSAGVIIKDVGRIAAAQNRLRTAVAEAYAEATNTVSWVTTDDIREITIIVRGNVTGTDADYARVAFNSDNAAAAATALADGAGSTADETADVSHEEVPLNTLVTFRFSDALLRLDVLPVDVSASATAFRMFVGAK